MPGGGSSVSSPNEDATRVATDEVSRADGTLFVTGYIRAPAGLFRLSFDVTVPVAVAAVYGERGGVVGVVPGVVPGVRIKGNGLILRGVANVAPPVF